MNERKLILVALVGALCVAAIRPADATLHRFLSRRYAFEQDESTTTTSSSTSSSLGAPEATPSPKPSDGDNKQTASDNKPARLYPDLAGPGTEGMVGPPMGSYPPGSNNIPANIRGPTPFLPFGPAGFGGPGPHYPNQNPGPINLQPGFPQGVKPGSANPFATSLGERLLRMANGGSVPSNLTETRQALQNATVLEQLNRGVHSAYDNLAKAYNSTIQRQVEHLQDLLRNTTQNINPTQQRWAEQVGQFYKSMANRASQAQQQLNAAWDRLRNTNSTEMQKSLQMQKDQFPFGNMQALHSEFLPDLQRSLNMEMPTSLDQLPGMGPDGPFGGMSQPDMMTQLRNFWNTQVKPQVNTARGMIMRTWQDLTASGALNNGRMGGPDSMNRNLGTMSSPGNGSNFVDDILDMISMNGPEYGMIDSDNNGTSPNKAHGLMDTMQGNMMNMQRDINQLWKGLTNSFQSSIENFQKRLMLADRMKKLNSAPTPNQNTNNDPRMDQDPAENEISAKLMDINGLQRDADKVYEAVQREQYNQRLQEEQKTVSDRLKNFYNNLHIDENVNKLGSAVHNFWNRIPDHWNNMMNNMKPASSTEKPMI